MHFFKFLGYECMELCQFLYSVGVFGAKRRVAYASVGENGAVVHNAPVKRIIGPGEFCLSKGFRSVVGTL